MRRLVLVTALLTAVASTPGRAQDQIEICHATGNPDAPYVALTLDDAGVLEHINHEDDLVPAPAGDCPVTEVVLPEDTPAPTAAPEDVVPTPTPTATPTATPRPTRDRDREQDGAGVHGGGGGGGAPTLTSSPPAAQPVAADLRHLPMTGEELWVVAGAGIAFLLCGAGIRLLSPAPGRPPGPSGR